MFSKIVVLVDDGVATAALRPARTLARATGAVLVLVACPPEAGDAAAAAQAQLTMVRRALEASGLAAVGLLKPGDPGQALVELSHHRGVRLIVMTASTHSTRGEPVIDVLTCRVLAGSSVPVLVLRSTGRRRKIRTLMVPWGAPTQPFLPLEDEARPPGETATSPSTVAVG